MGDMQHLTILMGKLALRVGGKEYHRRGQDGDACSLFTIQRMTKQMACLQKCQIDVLA